MNNRYNYDRRNYGSRNNNTGSNTAGSIVFLISLSIILGIWVINLKSDIRYLSDDKEILVLENNELKHKMDSITKSLVKPKIECALKPEPKKTFRKPLKDTTKAKVEIIEVKPIVKPIAKPIVADTTKIIN
jgi:hypothetical protein